MDDIGGLQLVLTIDDDAVQAFLKLHDGGSFEEVKALEDCVSHAKSSHDPQLVLLGRSMWICRSKSIQAG